MRGSEGKTRKTQTAIHNQLNLKAVNHCLPGILSKCGAGKSWAEQRLCRFVEKSDFRNKCIHYNAFIDGHCDSIEAQKAAELKFEDLYEKLE